MKTILKIVNISKIYKKTYACKDITFTVNKGEFLSIVGESGSGKSTLVKIISNLENPSSGEIFYNELNLCNLSSKQLIQNRKELQLVFQDTASSLSPKMKVLDIICEPLLNFKLISKKECKNVAPEFLNKVNLDESFLYKLPSQMSGGQRQRINIARALTLNPKILILDEPTSALDVITQNKILTLLKDLQQKNDITIIFICHDLALVTKISDRIVVMKNGEVKEIVKSIDIGKDNLDDYTKDLLQATFDIKKCSCRFSPECPHDAEASL